MRQKKCIICKQDKPLNQFYKRLMGVGLTGRSSWCRLCALKKFHDYYIQNIDKIKKYRRNHYLKNVQKRKEYNKEQNRIRKQKAFTIIGNANIKCAYYGREECCYGQNDLRILQLDHINGSGTKMRKSKNIISGSDTYGWIIKHPNEAKKIFQILCANANWIKKHQQDENGRTRSQLANEANSGVAITKSAYDLNPESLR